MSAAFAIVDFTDELAPAFERINAEWIAAMFTLEPGDRAMLARPRATIIDAGGAILFAVTPAGEVIGTCALRPTPTADGRLECELTKMGMTPAARGLGAGDALLRAALERAVGMGVETLYLLTSQRCGTAIRLYERAGFAYDADIMRRYGAGYARCDVAMRHVAGAEPGESLDPSAARR